MRFIALNGAGDRGAVERNEELLLAVLNSAPVVDGHPMDLLVSTSGRELVHGWGGTGTDHELARLRRTRDALQAIVRGGSPAAVEELAGIVTDTVQVPRLTPAGVVWELRTPRDDRLPVDVVLAWSEVNAQSPGRLRACANHECNLFLVDHSRPGTAKWCSMATCGNRMKARAYATRSRH